MKRYSIRVFNSHKGTFKSEEKAGTAAVAINRALRGLEPSTGGTMTLEVKMLEKINYKYLLIADVPFSYGENGNGFKRERFPDRSFEREGEAMAAAREMRQSHPEYKYVSYVRVEARP